MRNSTNYGLAHTRTFRRSSKKLFDIWGSNLQNLESSVRRMYIPDGYRKDLDERLAYWLKTGDLSIFRDEELEKINVFVQPDQSGAEALIVAYLCRPGRYRQIFENKINPHAYLGMHLFTSIWPKKMKERGGLVEDLDMDKIINCAIPDLKDNPYWADLVLLSKDSDNWGNGQRYYYYAKQTGHSANYGIEHYTFRMNVLEKSGGKVVISDKDAKQYLDTYRGLYPEIPEWNEEIRRIVTADQSPKYLFNLFGHPYTITNYNNLDNDIKEYIAWIPQSTVGEITLVAFTNLYYYIKDNKRAWDILADTHDSYMSQGPLYDVGERIKKMREFIEIELESPFDGTKFRMRSDYGAGFNWCKYDEEKNPLGLQELKWAV